jgi:hypothetical protein
VVAFLLFLLPKPSDEAEQVSRWSRALTQLRNAERHNHSPGAIDRYERRALSRRKFAIRAFDGARMKAAPHASSAGNIKTSLQ